jgi:hypothetical protein
MKVFSQVSQASESNKIVFAYYNLTFTGNTWEVHFPNCCFALSVVSNLRNEKHEEGS